MIFSERNLRLDAHADRLAPALGAAALGDLLAELDANVIFRMPGNVAEAQRGFAVKPQPENQWQFFRQRQFQQRPILRQVAHHAAHVLILVWIENNCRHQRRAPRRPAFLFDLRVAFHGFKPTIILRLSLRTD